MSPRELIRRLTLPVMILGVSLGLQPEANAQQGNETLLHARPEAAAARKALLEVKMQSDPQMVYDRFLNFSKTHFGALADPLIYEHLGQELTLLEAGTWAHASENSASLAWETNLPAESYVEYGTTTSYGQQTEKTDRHYFLHLHQIKNLPVNQTIHYRLVAVDEKGRKIESPDQTFRTSKKAGAIYIPGDFKEMPYRLDKPGATYVLTQDLVAPGAAILATCDDLVIDLNGHTITYATQATDPKDVFGIQALGSSKVSRINYVSSNLKIFNGTILQGKGPGVLENKKSGQFAPISFKGKDFELAGVHIIYHAPQAWGILISHAQGDIRLHHNVFKDMGAMVRDRHGSANRTVGFRIHKERPNGFSIHHNLVKRTRQNGLSMAHTIHSNEVYVDSWSTNSFAIQADSALGVDAGEHYNNRIFLTGFNPYGFGWAHENLRVRNNFVYMFGLDVSSRWHERWGDMNMLSAMRVTNYGQGGQVRNNLVYTDNLIIGRAMENAEIRGVEFFSDETIKGLVFSNNVVKTEALDNQSIRVSAINAQGHFKKEDTQPVFYRNNTIIANVTNVTFGDSYGKGNNHQFENNRFIKLGNHPAYHTFRFGGEYYNKDHVILDGTFENGAAIDDVFWERTSVTSDYSIAWTLDLETAPGAAVTIKDSTGQVVYTGQAGNDGKVAIPLKQATIRPFGWTPEKTGGGATVPDKHVVQAFTPHEVSVDINGKKVNRKVNLTKKTALTLR